MGWASGSSLAESLWDQLRPLIPDERRCHAANVIVVEFKSMDCDTLCECQQLMEDAFGVCEICQVVLYKHADRCEDCNDH
jgi:hypothetical protein